MRQGYVTIGGGRNFQSIHLSKRDLESLLAEHFGFDPETVELRGVVLERTGLSVSGEMLPLIQEVDEGISPAGP